MLGYPQRSLSVPKGTTAEALFDILCSEEPRLQNYRAHLAFLVNQEQASAGTALQEGDEVVFLPPVSGGAKEATQTLFEISHEPLSHSRMLEKFSGDERIGALATFEGLTRRQSRGREVDYLEYDGYPQAALKEFEAIAEHCHTHLGALQVAISHRLGRVDIGQPSVIVVAAAAHRAQAFEACRYAIDRLKERAPLWKKEFWDGGASWIEEQGS